MRTHVSIIGAYYLLNGLLALLAAIGLFVLAFAPGALPLEVSTDPADLSLWAGIVCALLAVFYAVLARALFRLQSWARVVTILLAVLHLPGVGILIGVYMLWVCLSARGAELFSPQVRPYGDDQPRGYVARRQSPDDAPQVPQERGDAYPSGACMLVLFGIGALFVVGLPVAWFVYGAQMRRELNDVPSFEELVPEAPAEPTPAEAPATEPAQTPEAEPAQTPDGETEQPVLWRRAEQVEDLPGHWAYTDHNGTRHIVNDFGKIPEQYRPE